MLNKVSYLKWQIKIVNIWQKRELQLLLRTRYFRISLSPIFSPKFISIYYYYSRNLKFCNFSKYKIWDNRRRVAVVSNFLLHYAHSTGYRLFGKSIYFRNIVKYSEIYTPQFPRDFNLYFQIFYYIHSFYVFVFCSTSVQFLRSYIFKLYKKFKIIFQ